VPDSRPFHAVLIRFDFSSWSLISHFPSSSSELPTSSITMVSLVKNVVHWGSNARIKTPAQVDLCEVSCPSSNSLLVHSEVMHHTIDLRQETEIRRQWIQAPILQQKLREEWVRPKPVCMFTSRMPCDGKTCICELLFRSSRKASLLRKADNVRFGFSNHFLISEKVCVWDKRKPANYAKSSLV